MKNLKTFEELSPELLGRAAEYARSIKHGNRAIKLEIAGAIRKSDIVRQSNDTINLKINNHNLNKLYDHIKRAYDDISNEDIKDIKLKNYGTVLFNHIVENIDKVETETPPFDVFIGYILNSTPRRNEMQRFTFHFPLFVIPTVDMIYSTFDINSGINATDETKLIWEYCKIGNIMLGGVLIEFTSSDGEFKITKFEVTGTNKLGGISLGSREDAIRVRSMILNIFDDKPCNHTFRGENIGDAVRDFILKEDILGEYNIDGEDIFKLIKKYPVNKLYTDDR